MKNTEHNADTSGAMRTDAARHAQATLDDMSDSQRAGILFGIFPCDIIHDIGLCVMLTEIVRQQADDKNAEHLAANDISKLLLCRTLQTNGGN